MVGVAAGGSLSAEWGSTHIYLIVATDLRHERRLLVRRRGGTRGVVRGRLLRAVAPVLVAPL